MIKGFDKFNISDDIKRALQDLGYNKPTEVQDKVIGEALFNKDLLVRSQTGTGKTAAFVIPICEKINWQENHPECLILTPTRELALQISEDVKNIGRFKRIKGVPIYGKAPFKEQLNELKGKTHVVIGTPGRVLDHIDRKSFKKLPDELRQRLMDASMNVCVVDNGSDEMMNLIFRRINSGEQMSSFDISRSHRENLDDIRTLSNHVLFTKMLSKNTYANLKQHELVVKTWIALYEEDPRFTGKHVDEVMSKIEITPKQSEEMTHIFDKIYDAYMILTERNKPVTKLMFNKTHFITYIPYVNKFDTAESFADWLEQFFTNLPDEYVHAVSEGHSTTVNTVQRRFDIVSESVNEFTNK